MREIKFRGKALGDGYNFKAGEFVYGSLVFEGDEPYIVGPVVEANEDYIALEWWVPVDPATVEQCVPNTEKKALVQRIARLRKRERLQESIMRKLQVRVNQLEEVLEDYLELSETGQLCSIRCGADNNHCDTCDIVYLKNRIKELLGKEAD